MRNIFTQSIRAFALFSFLILLSATTFAQVGINTTMPKEGSILDVEASDLGIYFPRVNITNLATLAPITGVTVPANAFGLLVYNTNNTTGPGYFYWTGSVWSNVGNSGNDDWKIAGNGNTTNVGNFLGTTNNEGIRIKTNSFDRFDITGGTLAAGGRLRSYTNGTINSPIYSWSTDTGIGMYRIAANQLGLTALQVSVNGAPLFVGDRFTVIGAANEYAVNGYATGAGGVGVYGDNDTNGGAGVIGAAPAGVGVYGVNISGIGDGVFGNSSNVGVRGFGGNGALLEGAANNGFGALAWNTTLIGANRNGLIAIGQNLTPFNLAGTGAILYGSGIGGVGFTNDATGTGLVGVGNGGNTAITVGSGVSGVGSNIGVFGIAVANTGARYGGYFAMNKAGNPTPTATDDPVALLAGYNGTQYYGGYFDGNQDNIAGNGGGGPGEDYAYVGIQVGGTNYKIIGNGSVSTMIKDESGNKRVLFSPEAPEILFEDYGVGQLINGTANIQIDPLLSSAIHVSAEHPLKVFIQLEGDCNGVYVTNKSAAGFTVKELAGGRSNVPFSWHIVANREDSVLPNGRVSSKHVGVRFPIGPNKIIPNELTAQSKSNVDSVNETIPLNNKKALKSGARNSISEVNTESQTQSEVQNNSETKSSSDTLKSKD